MRHLKATSTLVSIGLLVSCQTMDEMGISKQQAGTGAGAVVGGILGGLLGGDNKVFGALAGAAIGGLIGNQFGKFLDERDRVAIQQETAKALEQVSDGEKVNWANAESGASAVITPRETKTVKKEVAIIRDENIQTPPALELIGKSYIVVTNANVRAAPTTASEVASNLEVDEQVNVVGKVEDKNWYLVSRNQKSIGYIYGDLIELRQVAIEPRLRQVAELDDIEIDAGAVRETVNVTTECRQLDYEIAAGNGQTQQDSFEACKATDGAWELG